MAQLEPSILKSIKKVLNVDVEDDSFDTDILMHVNSVFSDLESFGIGPQDGYMIEDDTAIWDEYLAGDYRLNSVKTFIYDKVRLVFDPPGTSFHINAIKDRIKETEFRLSMKREVEEWVDPRPTVEPSLTEF